MSRPLWASASAGTRHPCRVSREAPAITRRKSPSVKMPRSFPSASAITAAPPFACVIAMTVSMTVAVGATRAHFSPVRMMSATLITSARPIAPAGWFMA